MVTKAGIEHLNSITVLENRSFNSDKLSRRNLRYLLTKANASIFIDKDEEQTRGYSLILYNRGTSLARLYSLVVSQEFRGFGIGQKLLEISEQDAINHDCVIMRLEVRKDNTAAINLYIKNGYKRFEVVTDYYEDHMEALRFEKNLVPHLSPDLVRVPYYQQTTNFSCGAATLMMAMKALESSLEINRKLELRIWKESTTIFMTSGHGGCGPFGLALAAYHRGFDVDVYVNDTSTLFVDSVRDMEKKEVMRLVQEDQLEEMKKLRIKLHYGVLKVKELQRKFKHGGIPIVLISSYRIYREKNPHWVVVTGFDEKYIYVHDSFVDYEENKTTEDSINMPILKKDFERMSRYGKAAQKAVLIINRRK